MTDVRDPVDAIARAVLYEGYVLWPYRRSALKNRKRWTFGGIHPRAWQARGHADDRCALRCETLVQTTPGSAATVDVAFRWLHVVERRIARVVDGELRFVDALELDGTHLVAWDEAMERALALPPLPLVDRMWIRRPIDIAAGCATEWHGPDGRTVAPVAGRPHACPPGATAAIIRAWRALSGVVEASVQRVAPHVLRVRVDVRNDTPWAGADRDDALRSSFNSSHIVLRVAGGAFSSLTDPPPALAATAAACENTGCWPVLVGAPGSTDTMLAAPIILSDYPAIAPESPGDLFDGGEVDELLVLNILGLTDEEKAEMRAADPRTRAILERTEALDPRQMLRLHGTFRDVR
jgi:hypothetical protein